MVVGVEPGRGDRPVAVGEPDVSAALDVVEGDRLQVVVVDVVVQVAEGVGGGGGVECGAGPIGDADSEDDRHRALPAVEVTDESVGIRAVLTG